MGQNRPTPGAGPLSFQAGAPDPAYSSGPSIVPFEKLLKSAGAQYSAGKISEHRQRPKSAFGGIEGGPGT